MAESFFDVVAEDERRRLLAEARRRRFRKGDTVFHEGDPGDAVHVVVKGHVAVRATTPLGDVATFAVLGPGEAFGEQALLAGDGRRTASVVALEPTETLSLTRDRFEAVRTAHPAVDRFLVDLLAAQVRRLSAQLTEALYVPVETRLLRRLAGLAASFGGADVALPVTQDDLATLAGTTRPTANRILKGLEAEGVVALGRGRITVVDLDDLVRRAR